MQTPDALLLVSPGCTHCPVVLEGLGNLLKSGRLGRLEVINILAHPEAAQQVGTRSVPWCRIGPFELEGVHTATELDQWVKHAAQGTGLGEYYSYLLETQRPHKVTSAITRNPSSLSILLTLLELRDTPMATRIGIGVVLEDMQGSSILHHALPTLRHLAHAKEANIRADTAHYLSLIQNSEAGEILQQLLHDEHPDVREIAAESLAQINPSKMRNP